MNYEDAPQQQRSTKLKSRCEFTSKFIVPKSNENCREQPSQKAHIHLMPKHKNHTPSKYIFQIILLI